MPKKRFGAEQIVTLLRQIEVLMAQSKSAPEACRDAGVSQQNFRDGLLNGEVFDSLKEAQVAIEQWRKNYNTIRPHSALNYKPPAAANLCVFDSQSGWDNRNEVISIALIKNSVRPRSLIERTIARFTNLSQRCSVCGRERWILLLVENRTDAN